MFELRPYQSGCVTACIDHIMKSTLPIVAELATGAGKSLIVAQIAKEIHRLSKGKHILCLAPSAELVHQNRSKYLATGNPASLFSASAGSKCLRHPVVFGTPQTVVNAIDRFGDRFAMVIIDEAHGLTKSVKKIIDTFREKYPKLRVLGLTATPYRMGTGYIYEVDMSGKQMSADVAKEPYFHKLIYKITANELIDMGFLSPPLIGELGGEHYDTLHLEPNRLGKFDAKEIDKAFVGHGRKTAYIVADVIEKSKERKGIMFFAATVEHAQEVLASLPEHLSAIVTGETPKKERENILKRFKAQNIKYLVNVAVLTTGFDAPHVDVIALLRATESAGLLQQIIGRGLRLSEDKKDVLILDYAQNLERHAPDGDIFNPKITANTGSEGTAILEQICPSCKHKNAFNLRKNKEGYKINEDGYYTDLLGKVIKTDEGYALPAHYGRRCTGYIKSGKAVEDWSRCSYRWSLKVCEACGAENDIAARKCTDCKGELIDPNLKLVLEFKALKRDPNRIQIDEVIDMDFRSTLSQKGNECIVVDFVTPYRRFRIWLQKKPQSAKAVGDLKMFLNAKDDIKTIEYLKEKSGFYRILSYNKPIQQEPTI